MLEIWAVYAKPKDFPAHYVVRPMFCARDFRGRQRDYFGHVGGLYDRLEDIEPDMLALGLAWLPRFELDQPHIVGTWI